MHLNHCILHFFNKRQIILRLSYSFSHDFYLFYFKLQVHFILMLDMILFNYTVLRQELKDTTKSKTTSRFMLALYLPRCNKGKLTGPQKRGEQPIPPQALSFGIGQIKMKVYMIVYSVYPDMLLFNIFLEIISKCYSHEIMNRIQYE